jgi:phosphoglycerate-specific signal transduction histidine kinase
LREEVEERRATETRLRNTQAELVQAGKLAALGQMSAALSHEFNQPLAAVKAYADNADTFLERGRVAEARDNVGPHLGHGRPDGRDLGTCATSPGDRRTRPGPSPWPP